LPKIASDRDTAGIVDGNGGGVPFLAREQ